MKIGQVFGLRYGYEARPVPLKLGPIFHDNGLIWGIGALFFSANVFILRYRAGFPAYRQAGLPLPLDETYFLNNIKIGVLRVILC